MAKAFGSSPAGEVSKVTPNFASRPSGIEHPFLDASPPFILVFSPNRWTVMHGRLIPALMTRPLEAGVQNVSVDRDGRIHFAVARAKLEEQGRQVIPYEWGPDGESYVQQVDTRPRGGRNLRKAHITVWETAMVGSAETHSNEEAYADWAASLVADGKLPPCPRYILEQLLEKHDGRLREEQARVERGGPGSGIAQLRADAHEATVTSVRKELEGSKPKPVKGRKAKTKLEED